MPRRLLWFPCVEKMGVSSSILMAKKPLVSICCLRANFFIFFFWLVWRRSSCNVFVDAVVASFVSVSSPWCNYYCSHALNAFCKSTTTTSTPCCCIHLSVASSRPFRLEWRQLGIVVVVVIMMMMMIGTDTQTSLLHQCRSPPTIEKNYSILINSKTICRNSTARQRMWMRERKKKNVHERNAVLMMMMMDWSLWQVSHILQFSSSTASHLWVCSIISTDSWQPKITASSSSSP